MADKLNLAVLISGRGSNMEALIRACREEDFPARISLVIASNPAAAGLKKAAAAGIPAITVNRGEFSGKAAFEAEINDVLERYPVDLVCLAGFMHILSPAFVEKREGRLVNIHPSLLPAYKGLDTHSRVLEAGDSETGCTVHFVTAEMDAGPVIVQRTVPVHTGDTAETLAARVLEQEHKAYPEAIRRIAKSLSARIILTEANKE